MDFLNEINEKYHELEAEADKTLEKAKREEEKLQKLEAKMMDHSLSAGQTPRHLPYNEAIQRNANLLKAIDMANARLRSRSTFSPVEQILEKAIENYKRDLLTTLPGAREEQVQCASDLHCEEESIYETVQ